MKRGNKNKNNKSLRRCSKNGHQPFWKQPEEKRDAIFFEESSSFLFQPKKKITKKIIRKTHFFLWVCFLDILIFLPLKKYVVILFLGEKLSVCCYCLAGFMEGEIDCSIAANQSPRASSVSATKNVLSILSSSSQTENSKETPDLGKSLFCAPRTCFESIHYN